MCSIAKSHSTSIMPSSTFICYHSVHKHLKCNPNCFWTFIFKWLIHTYLKGIHEIITPCIRTLIHKNLDLIFTFLNNLFSTQIEVAVYTGVKIHLISSIKIYYPTLTNLIPFNLTLLLLVLQLSHVSRVRLCATLQTAAQQAPPTGEE